MNVNFGLFPPLIESVAVDPQGRKFGRGSAKNLARKGALSARALADLERWIEAPQARAAE
jgi:methylenetetrahydrofolate--tRNA-(uracil-5-)-methyltransferase